MMQLEQYNLSNRRVCVREECREEEENGLRVHGLVLLICQFCAKGDKTKMWHNRILERYWKVFSKGEA